MTTQPMTNYDHWIGRDVYDPTGEKIGTVDNIFYDDLTGRPEWITLKSGIFGAKKHFVPIIGSSPYESGLMVNYDKAVITDAPNLGDDMSHLSPADEEMLYKHYNIDWNDTEVFNVTPRADDTYTVPPLVREEVVSDSGTGVWEAVEDSELTTRSEVPIMEKETVTGKVRLRKYRITEQVTMPVTREEVRIETETDSGVTSEVLSSEDVTTTTTGDTTIRRES